MEKRVLIDTHLHEHSLEFAGTVKKKWYCDSLNVAPNKMCFRNHKKEYLERSHGQYACKGSCNFTLCDLCVEAYKKDKPFNRAEPSINPLHAHKLVYMEKYPNKWYCDNVLMNSMCYRGHSKSFALRHHGVYKCAEGCNFLLCDYCFDQSAKGKISNYKNKSSLPEAKNFVAESNSAILVPFHPHPLSKSAPNLATKWYCDGLLSSPSKRCHRGHSKVFSYHNEYRYTCAPCNFTLCDSCTDVHNFKDGQVDVLPLESISGDKEMDCVNLFIDSFAAFADEEKFIFIDQLSLLKAELENWKQSKSFKEKEFNLSLKEVIPKVGDFLPGVEQMTEKTVNLPYAITLERLVDTLRKIIVQIFGMG